MRVLSDRRRGIGRATVVIGVVLCGAFALLALLLRSGPVLPIGESTNSDPRWSFESPYSNIRPDAAYVGDDACIACHAEIAKQYAGHSMGRSMAASVQLPMPDDTTAHNPFQKGNIRFHVTRRDHREFHREELLGEAGEVLVTLEREVPYAIGSGSHGRSYLTMNGGCIHQSPISWFSEKRIWDLSPGYQLDRGFNRPVPAQCLFCHVNQVEGAAGAINRYEEPIFRGQSIGCERCHGPGQQHIERQSRQEVYQGEDRTIVNPKDLTPHLRESVCQQCHLQGEERVVRRDRQVFDYRPGMPIELFWTTFVRVEELAEQSRSVGQIEQMQRSRCFTGSGGELGCISCHDPHRLPATEEKVAFYRNRCMSCHADKPCNVPVANRTIQQKDDSCIACHMPKNSSTNIVHTAVTNHRVPRKPEAVQPPPRGIEPGAIPIRFFHEGTTFLPESEQRRDLGIALSRIGATQGQAGFSLTRSSLRFLETAVQEWPYDIDAKIARATSLRLATEFVKSLALLEDVLQQQPESEMAWADKAICLELLHRPAEAKVAWEQVHRLNPNEIRYPNALASLAANQSEWNKALEWSEVALTIDPFSVIARTVHMQSLRRLRRDDEARKDLIILKRLRPTEANRFDRIYAE